MLDKMDFLKIKSQIEKFDEERENLIKKSRDVIKLSKQIIFAVHRDDLENAEKNVKAITEEVKKLEQYTKKQIQLAFSGSYKVALQEYVEALCYFNFVKNRKIPNSSELGVDAESYLMGLCDLTGELVRKAIDYAIKEKYDDALAAKELVSEIYGELLQLDLRDNDLRRKFDGIKYDLKKLEDLSLQIKMKGKI